MSLLAAALVVAPVAAFAQNLIQDPGFEQATGCGPNCTGALSWTYTGAAYTDSFFPNSGSYALGLSWGGGVVAANNNGPGSGTASQSVTVLKNGTYTFSFFEEVIGAATYSLKATVGTTTAFNAVVSNNSYVKQTTTVALTAGTDVVEFSGANISDPTSALLVDDVNLSFLAALALSPPVGAPTNAVNVANAINNFASNGGTVPTAFNTLYGLSNPALVNALSQLDGEVTADAEFGAFEMMTQFLGFMLDPFVDGRLGGAGGSLGGSFGGGGQAIGFAPDEQTILPPDMALAYASILNKAPPAPFVQRWTAWGTSYGGGNFSNGNATSGASNVATQTFGFTGGMDYHYSPDTIFGFALGGGGINWGLASGNGAGRSDSFQSGVYAISRSGPAYFAAALAFANHWMTTNRAALGDELTANFDAQSYGGRVEGGYRFAVLPTVGATTYAAVQAQDFHTPSFSESDLTGGGFGLSYASMNATDVRTELGSRFDNPTLVAGMPLILRARVAWAHDFVSNPALSAGFESLPGTNFVVNGAPIPHDSALASAGAELYLSPHWILLAKFDGEFAPGAQTYAGTGTVRYTW